jgi:hypothetical protein
MYPQLKTSWHQAMLDFENCPEYIPPQRVYHGTRTPIEKLLSEGLRYPSEQEFLIMIRQALEAAGLSYDQWLDGQAWLRKKGRLHRLQEMKEPYRQKIWTTDDPDMAWRYAERAPELVSESVRCEIYRLYWRRKAVVEMANAAVDRAMAVFGKPVVVVLDARKIHTTGGCGDQKELQRRENR